MASAFDLSEVPLRFSPPATEGSPLPSVSSAPSQAASADLLPPSNLGFQYYPSGAVMSGPLNPGTEAGSSHSAPSTALLASLDGLQVSGTGVHPGMANGKPGGDCRRLCQRHQRMAHEGTNRSLQNALNGLPPADQEAVTAVWGLFSSSHGERRKLMLQGLLTICCPSQLSFLSDALKHVCRIDPFTILPREISLTILSYVDAISLGQAAQVSRLWRKLADDDLLWRTMCQQHIERKCDKCGWGLPSMEKRRRAKGEAALAAAAAAHAQGHVLEGKGKDRARARSSSRSSKRMRTDSGIPSPTSSACASPAPSRDTSPNARLSHPGSDPLSAVGVVTRPWKAVYTERLALERNWRRGQCSVSTLKGHTDAITCLQLEDDLPGVSWSVLATGGWDRTVRVWNLDTGKQATVLTGHTRGVRCLKFDGAKLISGSMDGTIKIWNWRAGACIRTITGHTDAVISLTFDNQLLVSGSADSTIRVWNFTTGSGYVLRGHHGWVNTVALWSPPTPSCSSSPPSSPQPSSSTAIFTPPALSTSEDVPMTNATGCPFNTAAPKLLFSGSDDGQIRVWDLNTRACVRVLEGHVGQVQTLKVVTVDDGHLSSARAILPASYGLPKPSSPAARSAVTQGNGYDGFFDAPASSPRPAGWVPASSLSGQAQGLHLPSEHFLRSAALPHPNPALLLPLDFGPPVEEGGTGARPFLVSGSLDNCIKVWDLEKGACERTMFGHIEGVWGVDADRLRIVSASHDRSLKIWDRQTGQHMHTLVGHRGAVTSVALGDDKIVTGSDDGDVKIWSFAPHTAA